MADENTTIPAQLRAERMKQGLELGPLARELKNPRTVLEAIEAGEWARLGAPVFARHLVGRYAARLGVSVDLDEVSQALVAPELRSQVPASRLIRVADFSARHAAYLGGTLLIIPLVYTLLNMAPTAPSTIRPLDPPVLADVQDSQLPPDVMAPTVAVAEAPSAEAPSAEAPLAETFVAASENAAQINEPSPASVPKAVSASLAPTLSSSSGQLELRFSGDSWIEVFGRDGGVVERVLAQDGDVRRFPIADVGRVTIGNVGATEVALDGSRVNLEAVRAANVARFALSSDGSIEAVAR